MGAPPQGGLGSQGVTPSQSTGDPANGPSQRQRGAQASDSDEEKVRTSTAAVIGDLTRQLEQAAHTCFQTYHDKMIRLTEQCVARAEANLQSAANRRSDRSVGTTQQVLAALFERVEASRAMVETMVARFEALESHSATVVEKTHQQIREAGRVELESAQKELAVGLHQELESTTAILDRERQALIEDMVARTINSTLAKAEEKLAVRTNDRLSKAYSALKRHHERMIDELKQQADQTVLAATSALSAKFETMLREHQEQLAGHSGKALESFESGLQTLSGQMQAGAAQLFLRQLQTIADETAESEKVRRHLQEEAVAATEMTSKELHQRLSVIAEEFFASSSKQLADGLRGQVEAQLDAIMQTAPQSLNERLRQLTAAAGATVVKVSRNQLDKFAATLFESSSRALRQEVEQLTEGLRNELQAFQATLVDESRKELLAAARSTLETFHQKPPAGAEKLQVPLNVATQPDHLRSVAQLEADFQEALEKLYVALCTLLRHRTL